jgi:P27 family predicted phage terminase small subunit
MGKRGPRPQPTKLKVLRGNPGCRRLNQQEPEPPHDGVVMPSHLGSVAQEKWRHLLPLLQAVKVMTRADVEALARYCDTYEWWLATRAKLRTEGDTYPILNDAGQVKYIAQRPEVSIAHKLAAQLRQLEQDFGLNPSARSSLSIGKEQKPTDEVEEFFKLHGA